MKPNRIRDYGEPITIREFIAMLLNVISMSLMFAICVIAPEQEYRITAFIAMISLIISERIKDE